MLTMARSRWLRLDDDVHRHAFLRERVAERGEGACGARLDRSEGHVLPRGDLGVAEAFEERDLERLPLGVGKRRERAPYLLALARLGREAFGIPNGGRRL